MKTTTSHETVYVIGVLVDNDTETTHRNIYVTTHRESARRRLHREIRKYIDSWHCGEKEERLSKEEYFNRGFVNTDGRKRGNNRLIEDWVLDEDGTYVEFYLEATILEAVHRPAGKGNLGPLAEVKDAIRKARGILISTVSALMGDSKETDLEGTLTCFDNADAKRLVRRNDGKIGIIFDLPPGEETCEGLEDLTLDQLEETALAAAVAAITHKAQSE